MDYTVCALRTFPLVMLILAMLSVNGKSELITYRPEGDPLELLYSQRLRLVKMNLETPSKTSIVVGNLTNAVAIDYHFEKELVVWTDVKDNGIYSASVSGKGATKILVKSRVVTPDGLAVDWIHDNIYWTDTGTDSISVASLDGGMRKLLFETDLSEPRAIVLNPLEGWMFWTDWGSSPKIERSGMDGSFRSTIVSKNIEIPNGLAIDYEMKKLFWADVQHHVLRCSNYDGTDVKDILFSRTLLGHPFAVDVHQDWMYWTDWRRHEIFKAQKVTGSNAQAISSIFQLFPMGLKVYHRSKQPSGRSFCGEKNAMCPYLCLPSPKLTAQKQNFTCACPDGELCTTTPKPITTTSPSPSKLQSNSVEKILHEIHETFSYGKLAGITFGTLVALIIAISLVVVCIYKPTLNFRRHVPSLNFVNPVFGKQTEGQV